MGKSSQAFMELQEQFRENQNLWEQENNIISFSLTETKKSIVEKAENFYENISENGEITKEEAFAKAIRNATYWQTISEKIKETFEEKTQFYGVEVTPMSGKQIIQYEEDTIYSEILKTLKDRANLLKLAQTQETADLYGNIVPVVSVKFAKDSKNVKF